MPDVLSAQEIFFTTFEPKVKNRYIWYIDGVPSFLVKAASRPSVQFETITLDHIGNQSS